MIRFVSILFLVFGFWRVGAVLMRATDAYGLRDVFYRLDCSPPNSWLCASINNSNPIECPVVSGVSFLEPGLFCDSLGALTALHVRYPNVSLAGGVIGSSLESLTNLHTLFIQNQTQLSESTLPPLPASLQRLYVANTPIGGSIPKLPSNMTTLALHNCKYDVYLLTTTDRRAKKKRKICKPLLLSSVSV
jgi:hypothetical protein